MEKIVEVRDVYKSYKGNDVLKGLNFGVKEGEFFGLLGHNGAGKSTTIDCILGLQPVDSGSICLLGKDSKKISKQDFEKIGVQFQQSNYPKKLKVAEICRLTSSYYEEAEDWKKLLSDFGLEGKEKQMIEHLSGGEKQKLSVLLTLIPRPKIIFLDELTTGLDVSARRTIWNILRTLKEKKITVILTSHYMDEVENLCDRIGILNEGKIGIEGTVPEVLEMLGCESLEEAYLCYTERKNG